MEIKKIRTYSTFSGYTTNLKRTTLHIMDDTRRIASVHNWSIDGSLSEINSSSELNTNKIRYQYGNHIDSASLELSSTGSIISYEEYFPYGDTSLIAGTAQKEVKLKEYRYTGKEKDDVTGLYYYGARYYASWLGRWMSTDPLFRENPSVYDRPKGKDEEAAYWGKVYGEGLNLYCYVRGNPITFSDPTGRISCKGIQDAIYKAVYFWSTTSKEKYSSQGSGGGETEFSGTVEGENKLPKGVKSLVDDPDSGTITVKEGGGFGKRKLGSSYEYHKGIDVLGVMAFSPISGTVFDKGYGEARMVDVDGKGTMKLRGLWYDDKDEKIYFYNSKNTPQEYTGADKDKLDKTKLRSGGNGIKLQLIIDGITYTAGIYHFSEPSPINMKTDGKATEVKAGDQVGTVGTTGRSTGAHTHFEIFTSTKPVNIDQKYWFKDEKTGNYYIDPIYFLKKIYAPTLQKGGK